MNSAVYNVCAKCYCYQHGLCAGTPFSHVRKLGLAQTDLLGSSACRRLRFADTPEGLEVRIVYPYLIPWTDVDTKERAGIVCNLMLVKRWFMAEDRVAFLRAIYEHFGWDGPGLILVDIELEREVADE